jgi:predicted ATPase
VTDVSKLAQCSVAENLGLYERLLREKGYLDYSGILKEAVGALERAASWERNETADAKLRKLERLLAPGAHGDDEITLLAELLSLPNTSGELNLNPQRKREKLFDGLLHQFEFLAKSQPVLMVFEDAHWIDPTSWSAFLTATPTPPPWRMPTRNTILNSPRRWRVGK